MSIFRNLIAHNEFAVYGGEPGSHRVTDREIVARDFADLRDRLAETIADVIIEDGVQDLIDAIEDGRIRLAEVPDEVLAELAKFVRRPVARHYATV